MFGCRFSALLHFTSPLIQLSDWTPNLKFRLISTSQYIHRCWSMHAKCDLKGATFWLILQLADSPCFHRKEKSFLCTVSQFTDSFRPHEHSNFFSFASLLLKLFLKVTSSVWWTKTQNSSFRSVFYSVLHVYTHWCVPDLTAGFRFHSCRSESYTPDGETWDSMGE